MTYVTTAYAPWHRPLLAQPGPSSPAIHWALASSLISLSSRMDTWRLPAAALAAGEISPTLDRVHMAPARTAEVDTSRRYRPTTSPSRY